MNKIINPLKKRKKLAEREGFEPPEPFGSMVFKTTAFDHSAISPHERENLYIKVYLNQAQLYCNFILIYSIKDWRTFYV